MIEEPHYAINKWSAEDRPREKLLLKGKSVLSNAELLAILLGTGSMKLSAVDLAKKMMAHAGDDLHSLAGMTVSDLTKLRGIGEAKAVSIVAAFELGRRRKESEPQRKGHVNGSREVFEYLRADLQDVSHEEFWIVLLNRANRIISKQRISVGGVAGTVADPKIIFKIAIENLACGIILAHNHPSGNLSPSEADLDLTRKLKAGARLLEMQVLDHVILSGQKYYSFADEGIL